MSSYVKILHLQATSVENAVFKRKYRSVRSPPPGISLALPLLRILTVSGEHK